jgi:hypothetical protein
MLDDAIEVVREYMPRDNNECDYDYLMRFIREHEELAHEVSFVKAELFREYMLGLSSMEYLDITDVFN